MKMLKTINDINIELEFYKRDTFQLPTSDMVKIKQYIFETYMNQAVDHANGIGIVIFKPIGRFLYPLTQEDDEQEEYKYRVQLHSYRQSDKVIIISAHIVSHTELSSDNILESFKRIDGGFQSGTLFS